MNPKAPKPLPASGGTPSLLLASLCILILSTASLLQGPGLRSSYSVQFQVRDEAQEPMPAKLIFLGLNESQEIDWHDFPNFDRLNFDPSIGRYWVGSSYAILTPTGTVTADLDSGTYLVIASRGPEYSIDGDTLTLPAMADTLMSFILEHLVDVPGMVSADFHVHSAFSRDSRGRSEQYGLTFATGAHRILDYITSGVDVMVSADHSQIIDFDPYIEEFAGDIGELDGFSPGYITQKIAAIAGDEFNLYIQDEGGPPDCPPPPPIENAHFQIFPLREGQAPMPCDDVYRQPATLYDMVGDLDPDSLDHRELIQLNHPRGAHYEWLRPFPEFLGGPQLGWFYNWGYDPHEPIPPTNDGSPNSFLRIQSELSSTQNIDFDAIEILNRNWIPYYMESRLDWFSFLDQGFRKVATGNTDSHLIFIDGCGYPRNYVASNLTSMEGYSTAEENAMVDSVLAGDVFVTTGPMLDLSINGLSLGDTVYTDSLGAVQLPVSITVRAAPWIPVDEVRLIVNHVKVFSQDLTGTNPGDPFSSSPEDVTRFDQVIFHDFTEDSWVIVEAGIVLPAMGTQPESPGLYKWLTVNHLPLAFTNPIFVKITP